MTLSRGQRGGWIAHFRIIRFQAGNARRDVMVVSEPEAQRLLERLSHDGQRLSGELGHVRAAIREATPDAVGVGWPIATLRAAC